MPLRCCFVTAELAPLVKAGGLADAAGALAGALHSRGVDLRVFLPMYAELDRSTLSLEPEPALANLELDLGRHRYRYSFVRARRAAGPDLLLVDCPELYGRPGVYGDAEDEHHRFALLCHAALEACARTGFAPQIVHCHDWHTALLPTLLRQRYGRAPELAGARSLLTVHNLGYQGWLPASVASDLGLPEGAVETAGLGADRINLLRQGLRDADAVSTVSPTYAKEICSPELGMGLDEVLRARGDEVTGILNGVDYTTWDPATDPHLPHHYSAADLAGKARMRAALCGELGLEDVPGRLLVGIVSRLVWQKGVDLLEGALDPPLADGRIAFAALGAGEPANEALLEGLARRFPGRAAFRRGYNERLAHWIEAGADAFLMPSRYEPCGLNQMYSLRYGTVPLVRRTGGLADSVRPFDPATGEGTGIVFNDADPAAVRWAVETAAAWHQDRALWSRIVANGMREDFSWDRAVEEYLQLYRQIAERA
jgi:starch synthase